MKGDAHGTSRFYAARPPRRPKGDPDEHRDSKIILAALQKNLVP